MSVNSEILDKDLAHQLLLDRYAAWLGNKLGGNIQKSSMKLLEPLIKELDEMPPHLFTMKKLEQIIKSIAKENGAVFADFYADIKDEMREFVKIESDFNRSVMIAAFPKEALKHITVERVAVGQVYQQAIGQPMQGQLLKGWADQLASRQLERIHNTIAIGYSSGESTDSIVRQIRGTAAAKYRDGVLEISNKDARTIVKTTVGHFSYEAKEAFREKNLDLIKEIQWVSTLDNKTSPPCMARDGKRYNAETKEPIGHKYPWGGGAGNYHFNCRSTYINITKSWRDLGIDLDDLSPSERASMDGQVPADMTFSDWLADQPMDRVDRLLGKTRAELYKSGKIRFDSFFSSQGDLLTLDDLRDAGLV